jgi:glycyl-tRNA synthetase|tara:strand:- start:201 stop:575 length:375 start_codon:yes stop_codon:yes gene_type:complete
MILCNAFIKENSDKKNSRIYLKLNFSLSPIKFAILPLIKNKDIIKISKSIFNNLKSKFKITYEENKSIGRRYKKQDLIGTPYCITVDYQTIIDNTITLRDRDTTNQIRININNFNSFLSKFIFS